MSKGGPIYPPAPTERQTGYSPVIYPPRRSLYEVCCRFATLLQPQIVLIWHSASA